MGSDTRDITTYLKGVAIAAVIINHFLNRYVEGSQGGFANAMVSIFFLLSGYGLYYSFEKRFKDGYSLKKIGRYYLDRGLRIIPIYFMVLLINDQFLHLKLDYWFIPAIIHCYIASVPLYYILKKFKKETYYALFIIPIFYLFDRFYAINWTGFIINDYTLIFQGMFLAHVFIFALGFTLPAATSRVKGNLSWPIFVVYSLFILYLRDNYGIEGGDILHRSILIFLTYIVCWSFIREGPPLFLKKLISFIGTHSFSIYLLQAPFLILLNDAVLVIVASPLLFLGAAILQKATDIKGLLTLRERKKSEGIKRDIKAQDKRTHKGDSRRFLESSKDVDTEESFIKNPDQAAQRLFVEEMKERELVEMRISPGLSIIKGKKKYHLLGKNGVIRSFGNSRRRK